MERLLIKNPEQSPKYYTLTTDSIIIGRQPYCDVVLSNNAVSREHAKLMKTPNGWLIEDLQSRNGVWVNGKRIDKSVLLEHMDTILVGETTIIFQSDSETAKRISRRRANSATFSWSEDEQDFDPIESQSIQFFPDSSVCLGSGKSRFRSAEEYEREIALLEERLRVMLNFARILGKAEDVVDLTPRFLSNLLRLFPKADSACLLTPDDKASDAGKPVWKLLDYKRRDDSGDKVFRISRAIVRHVVTTRSAILSKTPSNDHRFNASESLITSNITSVMAAPVYDSVNNKILGVIQIDARNSDESFNENELKLLGVVTNQVAVYWENQNYRDALVAEKIEAREMQVANQVQRGFLPLEPPKVKGYEFFDFYRPAKYVGGDYFDYISLVDGSIAIILGDVAGKGISASLLMAKLSSETRYGLALEKTGGAAVARLNRAFTENHWGDRFITLIMIILEPETGIVRIFNAGHLYPFVSKTNGDVHRIGEGKNGFPLGVVPNAEYEECVYQLEEGEAISIMSDGFPDAMNEVEETFSETRVREALSNSDGLDAVKLGRKLVMKMRKFADAAQQTDDQCLVVFRRCRKEA